MSLQVKSSSPALAAGIWALTVLACNGSITGDRPPEGAGSPNPGSPGNPSMPGGTGGTTGSVPPPGGAPTGPADPGRVSLRRLNRAEYNNTVRDLLGTTATPADAFEAD